MDTSKRVGHAHPGGGHHGANQTSVYAGIQARGGEIGYKRGDFPVCERQANEVVTLLAHQHITEEQIAYYTVSIYSRVLRLIERREHGKLY